MLRRRSSLIVMLLLILVSSAMLLVIRMPVTYQINEIPIENIFVPETEGTKNLSYIEDLTTKKIRVEVPERILLGNVAPFRVFILSKTENFGTSLSFIDSESYKNLVITPQNRNDAYENVFLEARLEMAYAGINPTGMMREPYDMDKINTFFWAIEPEISRQFDGTLWLYYVEVDHENNIEQRTAILARPVQIECVSMLNLNTRFVFWASIIVLSINLVLVFFNVRKNGLSI